MENTFVKQIGQYATTLLEWSLAHHNIHIINNLVNTNVIFILIIKDNDINRNVTPFRVKLE